MTDNRATELLRKLLDERGVKYSDFTSATRNGKAIFKTRWKHERGYAELSEWESTGSNNLFIQNVDPEQAIAATLGVDAKDCENLLWEFIGALDVADATDADKNPIVSDYARHIAATLGNKRATHGTLTAEQVFEVIERCVKFYEGGDYDAQEIADELNARAERTCEIESSYLNDFTVKNMCWYEFEMQCGYKFTWDEMEPPKFCPSCGGGVKAVDA